MPVTVSVAPGNVPARSSQRRAGRRRAARRSPGAPRSARSPSRWCARSRPSTTSGSAPRSLRQQPRALELQRERGQRVGEHVVQLARDAAALGQRRRLGVRGARLAQLLDQLLGLVAASASRRISRMTRNHGQQREQQAGDLGRVRVLRDAGRPGARPRPAADDQRAARAGAGCRRSPSRSRRRRSPRRPAGRRRAEQLAAPTSASPTKRVPGRQLVAPHAQREAGDEGDDAERHERPVAVQPGLRVGEQRRDHDRRHRDEAERAQGPRRAVGRRRGQVAQVHGAQTVGRSRRAFMGARVEGVSTHGWRRRFDPRADDEEALASRCCGA